MTGALHRISLLHATRKRVQRALSCKKLWLEAATQPDRIEHIFAMDPDDDESAEGLKEHRVVRVQEEGRGCVGAWNLAAAHSTGEILVQLSDDWVPQKGWDVEFERRLRDVSQPAVLRVSDGHRLDDLLCMAIFTRPWLETLGTFLHEDYFSMYSDDEFSFRAYKAGVVIDARDILLEHEHPSFDAQVTEDETYKRQNSSASYKRGYEAFMRRNPDAVGRWLHEGTVLRYYLPTGHEATEKGRVLLTSDALRLKQDGMEWRRLARKYEVLLTEKHVHVQVFRQFTTSVMKMLASVEKSLRGRLTLGRQMRAEISSLLSEWKSLVAGVDDKADASIEAYLKLSGNGVSLLECAGKRGWPGHLLDGEVLKSFRAQAAAQQKWWEGVKSVVADVKSSKADAAQIGASFVPPVLRGGIPVYIISFNQLTYLRNMVDQLLGLGVETSEIHVVDNKSSLPPLLDYLTELESRGFQVHRMERNLGPRGMFDPEAGLALPEVFAVTDPDLQFHADMPRTFREDMMHIAAWCGVWKCGCALNINERDEFVQGTYFQGKTIAEWEGNFWHDPVPGWPAALESRPSSARGPVFRASVDTTFAVYIRDRAREGFLESVRVAGCFEARHLPWYVAALDESGSPAMSHLRDGRARPRPSPGEMRRYRLEETSSTISKMLPASKSEVQWVCQPGTQYEWTIPANSGDAPWWRQVFEPGWKDDLFRLLREQSIKSGKPLRLIDLGSPSGALALWGALRCGRVHAVPADAEGGQALKTVVRANRFEHSLIVHEQMDSLPEIHKLCEKLLGEDAPDVGWIIHASAEREAMAGMVLNLARAFPTAVTGLILSKEKADADIPWDALEDMTSISGDGWRAGWRGESCSSTS